MLTYTKIDASHRFYPECERIWRESFPEGERPDAEIFRNNADSNPSFTLLAISKAGDEVVGLMTWWDLGDFIYGEHFAISPALRGNGVGFNAFTEIVGSFNKPIVFEVEVPSEDNPFAGRRIKFYERCGMALSDIPYCQPPYRRGDPSIPMRLMSSDRSFPMQKAKELIYRTVYNVAADVYVETVKESVKLEK